MKKRIKVSLRTKIYLTIVGLLSLVAGTVYGAGAFFFAPLNQTTGIAISPTTLYATQFCGQGLFGFDCMGNPTLLGIIPLGNEQCMEKYMSIAPIQSVAAGFTPTDLFISEGQFVFKFTPPAGPITFFKDLSGLGTGACQFSDHSSLKFDKVGTFGFNLIYTCEGGDVAKIDGSGNATLIGTFSGQGHDPVHIEGQEVMAATFGPLAGKLLLTDENTQTINAIDNLGNVTFNVFNWAPGFGVGVENIRNIPANLGNCSFGCIANQPIGTFFQNIESVNSIIYYPPTDFLTGGLNDGMHVLVTTEADPPNTTQGTLLVAFNPMTNSYVTSVFDATFNSSINEGAQFVDCDAVTPTPTPTSTPTATFTPTPTATATFTPTPTPTPTVTPTPTSTPSGVCPLTIGYWKNHSNAWPVNSLMLGSQTYTKTELLAILNNPGGGDASMIMAVQLIAAKLNIAAGSDPTPIASTIAHADSLLAMFSGKLPYHVAPSSTIGQMMVSDGNTLNNYNNGKLTPNCSGQRDRPVPPARPAPPPR